MFLTALLVVLGAAPLKVALLPLTAGAGVEAKVAQSLTDALAAELRGIGGHQLVTQQELTAVLGVERQRQLLGCTDTTCMAEIASALDVDALVTGSIARLGESWLLQIQLVDARKGVTTGHASRRQRSAGIDDLLDELPAVARELFRAGVAAAPPAVAAAPPQVAPPPPSEPPLPSPQADVALEGAAEVKKKLVLLRDGAQRYIAIEPFGGTSGGFFYGARPEKLYAQRVFGGGSSGDESFSLMFWEPRARSPGQASFDFRDGKYVLTCGQKRIELTPVKSGAALLAKAVLHQARWQRRAYALARDDEGRYFYVDQARVPEDSQDFRLHLGRAGQMRAHRIDVLAHDAAGDLFAAAGGRLKLQRGKAEAEWVTGGAASKLTVLPIEDHARFIYTQLGAYQGLELGTPCDGHL